MIPNMKQLCFCIVFIITLSACQDSPNPVVPDESLLIGEPCLPPCWQGLIPGQTTLEQANNFLQSSRLVAGNVGEQRTIFSGEFNQSWWWVNEAHDASRRNLFEFTREGILEQILIHPNSNIKIGQVLSKYGAPTVITMGIIVRFDAFDTGPEGVLFTVLYVDQKIEISWFEELDIDLNPLVICPSLDLPILSIRYFTVELAEAKENQYINMSPTGGTLIAMGDSIIDLIEGKAKIDCVEIR